MISQQQCAKTDKNSRELNAHGTPDFPCSGHEMINGNVAWHWHEEIEIIFIAKGKFKFKTSTVKTVLNAGDFAFVNANTMHSGELLDECILQSFVFHPNLITGSSDTVFAKKYMNFLFDQNSSSSTLIISNSDKKLQDIFYNAFYALRDETFAYEFEVRDNLSKLLLYVYKNFPDDVQNKQLKNKSDETRVQNMLMFIHKNYNHPITLNDISMHVGISERECLRCFKNTIQISPIQYLLKYRVSKSTELLIYSPCSSISEISLLVGFDSPSHYTQLFKRYYNCTPKEFRQRNMD